MGQWGHLARRFVGSVSTRPPGATDEAWARQHLLPAEQTLWQRLSPADRRHAVAVARRADELLGGAARPVLAAALLHDSGKVVSELGTFPRVGATLLAKALGRDRLRGRLGSYVRHDVLGAELLAGAGSDDLTVAWAREHHLGPTRWSVPPEVGAALKAADDD